MDLRATAFYFLRLLIDIYIRRNIHSKSYMDIVVLDTEICAMDPKSMIWTTSNSCNSCFSTCARYS